MAINGEPTNADRAGRIEGVLNTYRQEVSGEDIDCCVTDLITDLMHWCDQNNINFAEAVDSADMHFTAEKDEEEEEAAYAEGTKS